MGRAHDRRLGTHLSLFALGQEGQGTIRLDSGSNELFSKF